MTAPIELVTINGKAFEASGCRLTLAGMKIRGWKSVKYGDKRTRGKITLVDKSLAPVSMTQGTYDGGQVTVELLKQSAQALRVRVATLSLDGRSFGEPSFNGSLQYTQKGLPSQNDEFTGLSFAGNDANATAPASDPLYESLVFDVLKLRWNGLKLWNGGLF
jgi:hypothetical protein